MKWTRVAMAALIVAAAPALAQRTPVRILGPAPEQVVRGVVPITINANAVPKDGYWVVEIAPAGEAQATFFTAVASEGGTKATYEWNTRANWPDKEEPPRDGQYTIRVKTYDVASGRFVFVRSNELNVYVRNRISVPANQTTLLKYRFPYDGELSYIQKVKSTQQGVELQSENTPLTLGVMDVTADGATVTQRIAREATITASGTTSPSPYARTLFSYDWSTKGEATPGKKMKRSLVYPTLCPIPLPGRAVRIGDSWSAKFRLPALRTGTQEAPQPAVVTAICKLDGLEYFRGYRCAKVVADYESAVAGGTVKGKSTAFVDYTRGLLLRQEDYFSFSAAPDPATTTPGTMPVATTSTKYEVITAIR
jgi:hypothetical protein